LRNLVARHKNKQHQMVTSRSLRAEKRNAAKALGGSVLTNKVRFTTADIKEGVTPVLRELMYTKNGLQHQVENLRDLSMTQAAKIQELTDEVEQYKTSLCEVQREARDSIAKLKEVIQGLTRDNDEYDKQTTQLLAEYTKITKENKQLYIAINSVNQTLDNVIERTESDCDVDKL